MGQKIGTTGLIIDILGLIVAVLACFAGYLALPQLQAMFNAATPTTQSAAVTASPAQLTQPTPQITLSVVLDSDDPTVIPDVAPELAKMQTTETVVSTTILIATPTTLLLANIPTGLSLNFYDTPDIEGGNVIANIPGPKQLRVIKTQTDRALLELPDGRFGWTNGYLLTYEGDRSLLSNRLWFKRISDRDDLPFVFGKVVGFGGADGVFSLKDQYNLQSHATWFPVGTEVTVLLQDNGNQSYGSGVWYFVDAMDPEGADWLWLGYLPSEFVEPR